MVTGLLTFHFSLSTKKSIIDEEEEEGDRSIVMTSVIVILSVESRGNNKTTST